MILGGIAVVNMLSVRGTSTMLAEEYAPEVAVTAELRGASNRVMYAMRGYGLAEEDHYLNEAREELENIDDAMADARQLDARATHLKALKGQLDRAEAAISEYKPAVDRTVEINRELAQFRDRMDEAAAAYMTSCSTYLDGQNERMASEIKAHRTNMDRHHKITIVNTIIDEGNAVRVANFKAQATRDPVALKKAIDDFEGRFGLFDELRQYTRLQADLDEIDRTEKAAVAYVDVIRRFLKDWEEREALAERRDELGREVIDACKVAAEAGIGNTNRIATEAASALSASSTIMIVGLIVALIVGVLLAVFITRSIIGPINGVIQGLTGGSEQVASASEQLSSSSQQMSEGASEQASSLEEVSSSLEEMASMTRQNTDNAKQANTMASEANGAAQQSSQAMEQMGSVINKIKSSSDETAKIIKTIDEIAMQTNLLALNAAVEAARAGEAGRGFAVVAEEVRNLAQRSAEAAKNTADLIEESQRNAEEGVNSSQSVGQALESIIESVGKVAQLVSEVSAASEEQAQGIDQVNTAVAQMDKVTQSNAANAEESASASEELSGQARNLNRMVEELVTIVGDSRRATARAGGNGHVRSIANEPKPAIAHGTNGRSHERSPRPHLVGAGKEVRPEQVIPMDDDSQLKEF
jgi:methyl-accepting chemotaxis protein